MLKKAISLILSLSLIITQPIFAQGLAQLNLAQYLGQARPAATDIFRPVQLRYFSYDNLNNSFRILLDKGDTKDIKDNQLKEQAKELMDYFLIGVTLPNDAFWVNLRPDSPDNIIDPELEQTGLGKILLESDLQLKKDTASMTSPQTPEGKAYWNKLYQKAGELFGTENITIPTLTRPWIVPGEIIVRESGTSAYIYKATLKVMLEEDYLKSSQLSAVGYQQYAFNDPRLKELNQYSTQLIKELIIPKLTQEVNSNQRYAKLRQVYYSLVLSRWFKMRFAGKSGQYADLIDRHDLTNLTAQEPYDKLTYFKQYQESFAQGEYNLKEPVYTTYGQSIRSYMSGGFSAIEINISGPGTKTAVGGPAEQELLKIGNGNTVVLDNKLGIVDLQQSSLNIAASPVTAMEMMKRQIGDILVGWVDVRMARGYDKSIASLEGMDKLVEFVKKIISEMGDYAEKKRKESIEYARQGPSSHYAYSSQDRENTLLIIGKLKSLIIPKEKNEADDKGSAASPLTAEALIKELKGLLKKYDSWSRLNDSERKRRNELITQLGESNDVKAIRVLAQMLVPLTRTSIEKLAYYKLMVFDARASIHPFLNTLNLGTGDTFPHEYYAVEALQKLAADGDSKKIEEINKRWEHFHRFERIDASPWGKLGEEEWEKIYEQFFKGWNSNTSQGVQIQPSVEQINGHFKKFGLSQDISSDVFKKESRRILMENHPDRHMEKPEENRKYYEGKTKELLESYKVITNWYDGQKRNMVSSSIVQEVGGIDFTDRAMRIGLEPMGSFADLKLVLPRISNVAAIDLDNEFRQIQTMASSGIRPADTRILEFAAACYYRGEFSPRLDESNSSVLGSNRVTARSVSDEAVFKRLLRKKRSQ